MEKEYNEIPKGDHICDDGIDNLNHSEWTWKIVIDNDLKVWIVWINLVLFSATVWYCIAELFITYVWQIVYK